MLNENEIQSFSRVITGILSGEKEVELLKPYEEVENKIVARAERVLYDLEDSHRKIKLYSDILVPKAEELLEASETAYKVGALDFLSLINAQQKLLEFQLKYERAVADNQQRRAELEMLVGMEL